MDTPMHVSTKPLWSLSAILEAFAIFLMLFQRTKDKESSLLTLISVIPSVLMFPIHDFYKIAVIQSSWWISPIFSFKNTASLQLKSWKYIFTKSVWLKKIIILTYQNFETEKISESNRLILDNVCYSRQRYAWHLLHTVNFQPVSACILFFCSCCNNSFSCKLFSTRRFFNSQTFANFWQIVGQSYWRRMGVQDGENAAG